MSSKIISTAALLTAGAVLILYLTGQERGSNIAYVRTGEILEEFLGYKEAGSVYETKLVEMQGRMDTLNAIYSKMMNEYTKDKDKLSAKEIADRESMLRIQYEKTFQYKETLENKIREEDQELMKGVLNQINAFAEDYAKNKGYDIILGTTSAGNIMYGTEALDITKEFIDELNQYYKSGNQK